jgi:hypothetical protein
MKRGGMRNLGLLNEKTVMTGMSGKKVDEGWADFNGLTLIRPNKWAGPGGNSQNSFLAHHHHLISIPFSLGLVHMD